MRGFVIVLDSFGVGAAPDAAKFGDEGATQSKRFINQNISLPKI